MSNPKQSYRHYFSKHFSGKLLTRYEKVLTVIAYLSHGIVGEPILTTDIRKVWPKSLLKLVYDHKYLTEAQDRGYVDHIRVGQYVLTEEGLAHLESLIAPDTKELLNDTTELLVFSAKKAHDFDSLLRQSLSSAAVKVQIADSYVDETIFDTLLGSIPVSTTIELMYNHDNGTAFHQRAKRFKIQYPHFNYGHYPKLHDRYLIVDGIGFVIGPSLKDATVNAPAIIVRIDSTQTKKLDALFTGIFNNIVKNV